MRMLIGIGILVVLQTFFCSIYSQPLYKKLQKVDITIKVPKYLGKIENNIEYIDMNQEEPLLKYATFAELASEQHQNNKPFILAVVCTILSDNHYVHHFYWYDSLESFFESFEGLYYINPYNGLKIVSIQYFQLESEKSEFKYVGCRKDHQLLNPEYHDNQEEFDFIDLFTP